MRKPFSISKLSVVTFIICFSSGAMAAKERMPPPEIPKVMTQEEFDAAVRAAEKKADRKPANDPVTHVTDDRMLSPKMIEFKNEFFEKVRDEKGLDDFLTKMETEYANNKNPADARFFAAQLAPLRAFRSIAYRLRTLLEHKRNVRAVHSMILTLMRQIGTGIANYVPTPQWKAGFAYITTPFDGKEKPIVNDTALHDFLKDELRPKLKTLLDRLLELSFSPAIHWDNQIFFGRTSFGGETSDKADPNKIDSLDQFKKLGEAERETAIALVFFNLSALDGVLAYDIDGLLSTVEDIGKIYGFQTVLEVQGAPAEERAKALRGHTGFLKIMPGGEGWMGSSLAELQEGVRHAKIAWSLTKGKIADQWLLLDPSIFNPFRRIVQDGIDNTLALVSGDGMVWSAVTGKPQKINLQKFFTDPPKDLKAFFPGADPTNRDAFDHSLPEDHKFFNGKEFKFRNYFRGAAKGWDLKVYQKYFDGINDQKDVPRVARLLSQVWGGWIVGAPLTLFIQ